MPLGWIDFSKSERNKVLKDARIIFEDGKIHIYRNNTVSGEFDISDFSKSPNAVFRRIQRNLM